MTPFRHTVVNRATPWLTRRPRKPGRAGRDPCPDLPVWLPSTPDAPVINSSYSKRCRKPTLGYPGTVNSDAAPSNSLRHGSPGGAIGRPRRRCLTLAVAGLVLAGCTATDRPAASSTATASSASATGTVALEDRFQSVIADVLPSVVEIRTPVGLGSGVVYDEQGHIVTNAHVVGSSTTFEVLTSGSPTPVPATLVGVYAPNDLAVIQVADSASLRPAHFADSSDVEVGDIVLAMGNPLGLSATVTNGIISALGRTVGEPATQAAPPATLPDTIQTSAAINPGNSGGALVDMSSQVVGIPTLVATNPEAGGTAPGIGFAIPSGTVQRIADQLITDGVVTDSGRAALGIQATTVVDDAGHARAVGVVRVEDGGPAATAGIETGDVIVSVDGHDTPSLQALAAVLADLSIGQTVPVTVLRDGDQQDLQVTLGELGG